jgi:PAS domain S-box-containing protein
VADRLVDWHIHAALAIGTLIISLANYYAGPSTLYPILYTWTALYGFYFFPMRQALAQMALVGASYAVVLAVQNANMVIVSWLLAVGTPLLAGLLIARMLDRLQRHAVDLRQSDERTRLVLDTAPDAFITLDGDGRITTWNVAAERMFGWTRGEAVGRTMRDLIIPEEYRERHDERRTELVANDDPRATETYEVELVRRDGRRFPGEATVSRVETRGEALVFGFITDTTERLRRQAEREALLREQAARAEA